MIYYDIISAQYMPSSSGNTDTIPNYSSLWLQLRKAIIKEIKFELLTVLNDQTYRGYFVEYLQNNNLNTTMISLLCWNEIRKILEGLTYVQDMIITQSHPSPPKPSSSPPKSSHLSGKFVLNTNGQDIYYEFHKLLQGVRDLHKKYRLQYQHSPSVTEHNRQNHSPGNSSTAESVKSSKRTSSIHESLELDTIFNVHTNSCLLGISDTLRLEVVTLISHLHNIRLVDIESLDREYVVTNAIKIVKLLHVLERETFQHVQVEYANFVER